MRIVAGQFRGRRIAAPPGQGTRPMLDRVREALFSSLGARVDGAAVLDLFAGTGSLGLEALSRGAARARFVERDRRARDVLRENVASFDVGEAAQVRGGDALADSAWAPAEGEAADWLDLVFVDPPYPIWRERRGRARVLAALESLQAEALRPGGLVVLHTGPRDVRPEELGLERGAEPRIYGNTALWYLPLRE